MSEVNDTVDGTNEASVRAALPLAALPPPGIGIDPTANLGDVRGAHGWPTGRHPSKAGAWRPDVRTERPLALQRLDEI
jgi:hypothetical protein